MLHPPKDVDVVAGTTPTWEYSSTAEISVRPFDERNSSSKLVPVPVSERDPDEFWRRMRPFVGPSADAPDHYGFPQQAADVSLLTKDRTMLKDEADSEEAGDRSENLHQKSDVNYKTGVLDVIKWKLCGTEEYASAPRFPSVVEACLKLPTVPSLDTKSIYRYDPCGTSRFKVSEGIPRSMAPLVDSGSRSLSSTWLGHSAFLLNCDGISILTDPVFSTRASPVQFAGPARMQPPLLTNSEIPFCDVVTISHNHYDHLDTATVEYLVDYSHWTTPAQLEPVASIKKAALKNKGAILPRHPVFVVPMGMKKRWFNKLCSASVDLDLVVELYWWDTAAIGDAVAENRRRWRAFHGVDDGGVKCAFGGDGGVVDIKVTATPAKHWSMRIPGDRNKELFCGFTYEVDGSLRGARNTPELDTRPAIDVSAIMTRPWRLYHGGDTGYAPLPFQQTGSLFLDTKQKKHAYAATNENTKDDPHIGLLYDLSLIAIGAYSPRRIMIPQHINPAEAVLIHQALRSRCSIGMHWGTFILTDEPINQPPQLLKAEMEAAYGDGAGSLTPQERFEKLLFSPIDDDTSRHHPLAITDKSPLGHLLFASGPGLGNAIQSMKDYLYKQEGGNLSRDDWEASMLRKVEGRYASIEEEDAAASTKYKGRGFRGLMHGETWSIPLPNE